ncbi:MAG: dTDP-glucose 4,6-dehydratase [Syntrophobacteraceae bacterium]|nr:dTDP-glucose 4,6-dehydratase [Syntrophobacteraceae bacterium]
METLLVTGGAGFIGSAFVLAQCGRRKRRVINLDVLTYAGNLMNLAAVEGDPLYFFARGDIADRDLVRTLLCEYRIEAVVNFAAESHVDRSIEDPESFVRTNALGTFHLVDEVRRYWEKLPGAEKEAFRFLHVSTDEVYGSLNPFDPPFNEQSSYAPNSPYSASKAAGDHMVRAYHRTYGLPTLITHCSNNYGPRQFPEKLVPLVILNGMEGKPLPVYGDGGNVRDWLYVEDHCEALDVVLEKGRPGEAYNIGGRSERTNLETVHTLCALLDEFFPDAPQLPHSSLISFVEDRPGHDRRYAVDSTKVEKELGWIPREGFESGLKKTIEWYTANPGWVDSVRSGAYLERQDRRYGKR